MSKAKLIEEIKNALEQVSRQYEVFTWNNRLPESDEVEMLKNKLQRLSEKLGMLQTGEQPLVAQTVAIVEVPANETKPMETLQATILQPKAEQEEIVIETHISALIETDILTQQMPEEVKQPVVEHEKVVAEPAKVVTEVQTLRTETFIESRHTIAELYKEEESVHDKIGALQTGFAVADKLKLTPVSDLVKAIGLNEKFLFISELFKNDSALFHQMIDKLNAVPSYHEAYMLFDSEIAIKNNLDKTSAAYQSFLDLMQRRFMK